jgi:hypothetical protein
MDHDWGTALHPGDKVTWNGQTFTVATINTGDATLPQVVIDNFVRSGICMVKTVEPLPAPPANGAPVGFGVSTDGAVLTVQDAAPVWAAPPAPPPAVTIGDLSWYSEWTGNETWPAAGSLPSVTVLHNGQLYTAIAPVTAAEIPGEAWQWMPLTGAAMLEHIGTLTAQILALQTP